MVGKQYVKPSVEVLKINSVTILAGSGPAVSSEPASDECETLSRENQIPNYSIWDE